MMQNDWQHAVLKGDRSGIIRLLAEGVNIDSLDRYGQTALMLAAVHGHEAIVGLLLEHGADRDVTAKYGLSALMLAVVNHRDRIARMIVDAGANTHIRGKGAFGFVDKTARDLAHDAGLGELADYIARAEGADRTSN